MPSLYPLALSIIMATTPLTGYDRERGPVTHIFDILAGGVLWGAGCLGVSGDELTSQMFGMGFAGMGTWLCFQGTRNLCQRCRCCQECMRSRNDAEGIPLIPHYEPVLIVSSPTILNH